MDGYQHRHTPQAQVLHNSAMDLPFGLPLTGRMMVAMIAAKECASFGSLTTDIFVGSRHVSNGPNSAGRLFLREWSSEIDSLIAAARHIRGPSKLPDLWRWVTLPRDDKHPHRASSSSRAFACFKSTVSKPSVNQLYTGARSSWALSRFP
jgi:hypothetical protein